MKMIVGIKKWRLWLSEKAVVLKHILASRDYLPLQCGYFLTRLDNGVSATHLRMISSLRSSS